MLQAKDAWKFMHALVSTRDDCGQSQEGMGAKYKTDRRDMDINHTLQLEASSML